MRSFTIESVYSGKSKLKYSGGRFMSDMPMSAAKKALSQVCQTYKKPGVCSYVITIKETTQGSKNKSYSYRVSRKKDLKEVMLKNGETITFKYITKAKSV